MKKDKEGIFLEELGKTPIVSVVCQRVGLSRQTVYRWCAEDRDFKRKFDEAVGRGRDSINDLAESKLIALINEGSPRSIEYWLKNNKTNYSVPKSFYHDGIIFSELDRNEDMTKWFNTQKKLREEEEALNPEVRLRKQYEHLSDYELNEIIKKYKVEEERRKEWDKKIKNSIRPKE